MKRSPLPWLLALCALVACARPVASPTAPDLFHSAGAAGNERTGRPSQGGPGDASPLEPTRAGHEAAQPADNRDRGSLFVTVVWPTRLGASHQVQALPASTNAIRLTVTDASAQVVASRVLVRRGALPAASEVPLPVGGGYALEAKAYTEGEPTDSSEVIARGLARDLEVRLNRQTETRIAMVPAFAPTLTGLTPDVVGPGATIRIEGENLDRGDGAPTVIFPGGKTQTATVSAGTLLVQVPDGAGSGLLDVKVDGIESAAGLNFQEVREFTLGVASPSPRNWYAGATRTWLDDEFQFFPEATTSSGATASPAITSWSNASSDVGVISASGTYQARKLGTDEVQALSGRIVATRSVLVHPPAGIQLYLASAGKVSPGLSLVEGDGRFLVAFATTTKLAGWRAFEPDSNASAPTFFLPTADLPSERRVLAARREKDMLVVALDPELGLQFVALDPVTGHFKTRSDGTEMHWVSSGTYRLGALASFGGVYALAYHSEVASGVWEKKLLFLTITEDGTLLFLRDVTLPVGDDGERRLPPEEDSTVLVPLGDGLALFDLVDAGTASRVRAYLIDSGLNFQSGRILGFARKRRMFAAATNGQNVIVSSVDVQSQVLTYELLDTKLQSLPEGWFFPFGDLVSPGFQQVSIVWDGQAYVFCYTRETSGKGQFELVPVVRAYDPATGEFTDEYPIDAAGGTAAIVPTREGGVAAWTDPEFRLMTRRIRFHAGAPAR